MLLPQELFADALWAENQYGVLNKEKVGELLQRYNLKPKKDKSIEDIRLAIGRGFKNTFGNSSLAREQIAQEVDKVCIIARWDFAISKYRFQ